MRQVSITRLPDGRDTYFIPGTDRTTKRKLADAISELLKNSSADKTWRTSDGSVSYCYLTGEKEMYMAVLEQALYDLLNPRNGESRSDTEDARRFFRDGRSNTICELIGLDGEYPKQLIDCIDPEILQ